MADTAPAPNNAKITFTGKGKSMAKTSKSAGIEAAPSSPDREDWEAKDALRTMQRSEEHQSNPDMMKRVAKHAKKESAGLDAVMSKLRKSGSVSDKQAEKIAKKREGAERT